MKPRDEDLIKDFRNLWRERPSEIKGILFTAALMVLMGLVLLSTMLRVFGI